MKKVVLISGANKGIGFETAKLLARLGYYVYIGSRDKTKGLKAVRDAKESGLSDIDCIQMDITSIHSIMSARHEFGNKSKNLDVLINNAGIAGEQPQNISSGSVDNLRRVLKPTFLAQFRLLRHLLIY